MINHHYLLYLCDVMRECDAALCPLRIVSKLESQVKQLEHENQARARHASHSNTRPSGAG